MIRFDGIFPDTYKDIISLKGIGPYAAAAIGSFAFGLPYVVVDGNVLRVISRLFGIREAVDLTATKKEIRGLAQALLETQDPAEFNQAIMEFGALHCTFKNPLCTSCPFRKDCIAYKDNIVSTLPLKSKKIKKKTRYFHYLIIEDTKGLIQVQQRTLKDIWEGLYEFPLIEKMRADDAVSLHEIHNFAGIKAIEVIQSEIYKQTLTHQYIMVRFYRCRVKALEKENKFINIAKKELKHLAWPRIINQFLTQEGYI